MVLDYIHIRRETTCFLCGAHKSRGSLTCWQCFGEHHVDEPSPLLDDVMANVEQSLALSDEVVR